MTETTKLIYNALDDDIQMSTFANAKSDYQKGLPIAWVEAFVAMEPPAKDSKRRKLCYNKVTYLYNCKAYNTDSDGRTISMMPIYHAAALFYDHGQLRHVLLIKNNTLLDQLRDKYGPTHLIIGSRRLSDYWGTKVAVEIKDCYMEPMTDISLPGFSVVPSPGWASEDQRQAAKQVEHDLGLTRADGKYVSACCYRLCTPEFEVHFPYIHMRAYVDERVFVLTREDKLISEMVGE